MILSSKKLLMIIGILCSGLSMAQNYDQYATAEKFYNSGANYNAARFTRDNGDIFLEKVKMKRDAFFASMKKDDSGKIIEFDNELSNGIYKPNETAYPLYYFCKDGGINPYIYFIGDYAICTKDAFTSPEQLDKAGCSAWEVFSTAKLKGLNSETVKALLKSHLSEAKKGVDAVRAEEKAAAEKLEAEKRAKYTTEKKDVTKIRIETTDTKLVQGKSYTYKVIATLKDGSEISTANGGYLDEYEVSATGLPLTYTNFDGTFNTVSDKNPLINVPIETTITGDKVVLTVKSKFHKTLIATASFEMDYSENVNIDYNGAYDGYGGVRDGGSLKVEMKLITHAVSKVKLIEYKMFSVTTGDLIKHFKINQTATVILDANGIRGNPSKNGSDGGNMTVVIDPSVTSYNLTINNRGGNGGEGNNSNPGNGLRGADGTVTKLNQKVTW